MLSGFGFDGAYRLAAFVVRLAQRLAVPRRAIGPTFGCSPSDDCPNRSAVWLFPPACSLLTGQFPLASRGFVLCRVTARGLCQIGLRLLLRADMR